MSDLPKAIAKEVEALENALWERAMRTASAPLTEAEGRLVQEAKVVEDAARAALVEKVRRLLIACAREARNSMLRLSECHDLAESLLEGEYDERE